MQFALEVAVLECFYLNHSQGILEINELHLEHPQPVLQVVTVIGFCNENLLFVAQPTQQITPQNLGLCKKRSSFCIFQ
jgi:hypothetical protein